MDVLVVNAGSSSLKLRVLDGADTVRWRRDVGTLPPTGATEAEAATTSPAQMADSLREALAGAEATGARIEAAGHRVVHGGPRFRHPVRVDGAGGGPEALTLLDALADLAPLHNPPSLAAVHALRSLRPDLPQVACFDTAFHADLPRRAATYAVPEEWRRWGLRRYGFHGLSHAWASRRAAELLGRPVRDLRLVTAHLGAGASLAAVARGVSVDTTMGFTPLDGLVMATRSGSVDPGLVLWVQRRRGWGPGAVEEALEHSSGLLGLSGSSGDLRMVLEQADQGDDRSALAYEVYAYRIRTSIGAMAAALGGLDAVVFTGGAGEASPRLRRDVCAGLGFLGVAVDPSRNVRAAGDAVVSPPAAASAVVVVEAREDIEVARSVRAVLRRSGGGAP